MLPKGAMRSSMRLSLDEEKSYLSWDTDANYVHTTYVGKEFKETNSL